jgi:hypothetical protein
MLLTLPEYVLVLQGQPLVRSEALLGLVLLYIGDVSLSSAVLPCRLLCHTPGQLPGRNEAKQRYLLPD